MRSVLLERLFPNSRRFFQDFAAIAERLSQAAKLLEQTFDNPGRQGELSSLILSLDRETASLAHELDLGTERMLIPPMDREDIHLLSTRLGHILDIIAGAVRREVSLGARERHERAVTMARILVRATTDIFEAVSHLGDDALVLERCRAIKQAEEEGDAVWMAAMSDLFAGSPDPLDVVRWKTLYDQLEEALDACDDVANELETITVKHA